MRIIRGRYKSKNIYAPKNLPVRPTTDFAKEGLFNVIHNRLDITDCKVLDLFSGTGNITYEFASRDAKHIVSVDRNYNCFRFVKQVVTELKFEQVIPLKYDAFKYLEKCKESFDVIFADPPYDLKNMEDIHALVMEKDLLAEDGILVIEHGKDKSFSGLEHFLEHRKYGNVNFSFFQKQ
jgi:16S rRNA (guanine966-N2)-methyltransferase